jgi:hypothetical protein
VSNAHEVKQLLLDRIESGRLSGRRLMTGAAAAGLATGLCAAIVDQLLAAGEAQPGPAGTGPPGFACFSVGPREGLTP